MAPLVPSLRLWVIHRETYPIIACMAVALGWTTYMSGRALFVNPDVIASRVERGRELKDAAVLESRGEAWVASQKKHIAANPEKISIFGFERKFA